MTQGGAAPADGCTDASQLNATISVDYQADYYFFQQ